MYAYPPPPSTNTHTSKQRFEDVAYNYSCAPKSLACSDTHSDTLQAGRVTVVHLAIVVGLKRLLRPLLPCQKWKKKKEKWGKEKSRQDTRHSGRLLGVNIYIYIYIYTYMYIYIYIHIYMPLVHI